MLKYHKFIRVNFRSKSGQMPVRIGVQKITVQSGNYSRAKK